jgi:hypothetical protein
LCDVGKSDRKTYVTYMWGWKRGDVGIACVRFVKDDEFNEDSIG